MGHEEFIQLLGNSLSIHGGMGLYPEPQGQDSMGNPVYGTRVPRSALEDNDWAVFLPANAPSDTNYSAPLSMQELMYISDEGQLDYPVIFNEQGDPSQDLAVILFNNLG